MGVSDPSFLGLISGKVRSWIADLSWVSCGDYSMAGGEMGDMSVCHDCRLGLVMSGYGGAHCCQSCGRLFCSQCMGSLRRGNCLKFPEEESVFQMELCRFCFQAVGGDVQIGYGFDKKWDEPSSPEKSPDVEGNNLPDAPQAGLHRLRCSTDSIYEDDDDDDYGKNFLSPCSMFSHDVSDLDSSSFSNGVDFYSFRSSPLDSPSRLDQQIVSSATPSQKPCVSNQEATAYVTTPRSETEESIDQSGHYAGNNGSSFKRIRENLERDDEIWIPPPPKDVADDMEIGLFRCDDEDDDVAGTCHVMKSYCFDDCTSVLKEDDQKEALRDSVYDHFRALVSQMLRDEGICEEDMDDGSNWLGIVSLLAWQAANFVKPDTSREGSMDPSDYVKVKCIPSGIPSESFLIKGIVCTRNVRHKRMNTHHKNPRILIMGGELEFQKSHKLASMNALITDQKSDNLDMAFSKIEAHKPNILLVEKSVSPDAAQCMLSKGISLVTNVKRNLLQRIAKCTNARITESIDDVPSTRLGSCESFYVNRVSEECLTGNSVNRKPSKTLMFFDGCPRRLGCTVLLKGTNLEELKRVKRVVQFATFAAYHLSLETSFLADEGATLHKTQFSNTFQGGELPIVGTDLNSLHLAESVATSVLGTVDSSVSDCLEIDGLEKHGSSFYTSSDIGGLIGKNAPMYPSNSSCHPVKEDSQFSKIHPMESPDKGARNSFGNDLRETFSIFSSADRFTETNQTSVNVAGSQTSNEFSSTSEKNQNILVSLTRSCKGMICGRSQLLRIKFYGNFDKPLGRYLHENLFDQASSCESCREPMDSHVFCYTHQHGNLTINAKRLSNVRLSGERDGRIWMWHRCLKCASKDGIPPAAKRVIMSDAAWGLSFGKFLELSFSSHATANRLASCGHSLQKDCLRFYGCGNKVAFFRYAPVDILSVHLPPPVLDFSSQLQQKWLQQMSMNVSSKMEILHEEVLELLLGMEQKICSSEFESIKPSLLSRISFFKDLLERERSSYNILLRPVAGEINEANRRHDILVLNCSRRSLLIDSYTWDRRFSQLDSMLKAKNSVSSDSSFDAKTLNNKSSSFSQDRKYDVSRKIERNSVGDYHVDTSALENGFPLSMTTSTENISDKIDSAWTGCGDSEKMETPKKSNVYLHGSDPPKISLPQRFYSFNAILRTQERSLKLSSESRQLSSFNTLSYDDSQNFQKVSPSKSSGDKQNVQLPFGSSPSFISSQSCMETDGARLLLPLADDSDVFVAVYDDEPSSIIAYALSSKEYTEFVMHASEILGWNISSQTADNMSIHQNSASNHPALQSLSNDKVPSKFVTPEELMLSHSSFVSDPKQPHFRFSFDDESSFPSNKAKFSVTCYFARQFSALGKMCYPNEMDFVRSLSRCKKWSAEGGKSNAYFAKSLDDRFIIKQVTKTEMEAFEEFAPQYFSYLRESIDTGSPTCLAKILGIFQVTVKHLKGGREVKMDLMVMENLFYGREISRIYDLKGSSRSRYIADATGDKKVLLDSNLLEILQTKPIFLGSKAKRRLERAIWNDTAFLASIDVMDYSLLVGIDDERKQLVIGIIDFMRQYTWDKHLETWVKASGILGGPKNAAPTIVSPIQYKKRFRKAMSSYFLTVPDQWPS